MSSWVGGAVACLAWLGTHGGFSGCGTCTAWLGPWPRRLWRCVWVVRGVCVCGVCEWRRALSLSGWGAASASWPGSCVLAASEAAVAPFARPQMWSAPFPPAGLGWPPLEAGASVWRTGEAGSFPPLPRSSSWGRSELLRGQRGRAVLGTATYRGFLMGGESQAWHLASARPSLPPRGPLVCVWVCACVWVATEIARGKRTHEFLSLRLPCSACLEVCIVYAEFQVRCSYSVLKLPPPPVKI